MNKNALKTLHGFSRTEQYHRVHPNLLLTDGVKFLCENAECFWLMDIVASYLPKCARDPMLANIQFWHLRKGGSPTRKDIKSKLLVFQPCPEGQPACHVVCERDSGDVAIVQNIAMTDFPFDALPDLKLFVQHNGGGQYVICLPSEY